MLFRSNDTATTEIYTGIHTLSLHDALPISVAAEIGAQGGQARVLPFDVTDSAAARDAIAGRTLDGPHLTDLQVIYAPKGMPARDASTGEQKALLIAILLAQARLQRAVRGEPPLLLLDEVAAHLDATRRAALFEVLAGLDSQAWVTGTDAALFAPLSGAACFLTVCDGAVSPTIL